VGVPEAEIDAGLPRWCETFSAHYVRLLAAADTSHWQLAPHVAEAAAALEHRALLTGNPPAVAHARMERLGLAEFFPPGQGAFGCERENRIELFDLARERAGNWMSERTVAVGDTPLDVSSAHAAGCRCVGVTTGNYGRDELADADAVIADLGELAHVLGTLG
jgi:phosphoglycolate phosphatase-like HAD superfamily hydrolase